MNPAEEQPTPVIPPQVRTWAYAVGTFAAALAVAVPEPVARYMAALAFASNALAFGYRPTR